MSIDLHLKEGENLKNLNDLLNQHFGFRGIYLFEQFCNLAAVGDPCDICTQDKVYLNATIDQKFLASINTLNGFEIESFVGVTSGVRISYDNGTLGEINFKDIIAIYPMPGGDPTEKELAEVDMDESDDFMNRDEETVWEVISRHYLCKDDTESEKFVRRYLASCY